MQSHFSWRRGVVLAGLLPVLGLMAPRMAQAQSTQFEELMMGTATPITIKLGDMKEGWRQIVISGALEGPPRSTTRTVEIGTTDDLAARLGALPGRYFTQGRVLMVGGEPFVLAYQLEFDAPGMEAAFAKYVADQDKDQPADVDTKLQTFDELIREKSSLNLVLLNARQIGSMRALISFDLDKQLAPLKTAMARQIERTEAAAPAPGGVRATDAQLFNLAQIGAALATYVEENAGVLPPMEEAALARKALLPYARNPEVFIKPGTTELFTPNPILSGRRPVHISNPHEFVAFYDATPGTRPRAVLYLDGKVARVDETTWARLKKASKMP